MYDNKNKKNTVKQSAMNTKNAKCAKIHCKKKNKNHCNKCKR